MNTPESTGKSEKSLPNQKNKSQLNEKPSGELVLQTLAMPMYTNPNGDIFGGWLLSQMDLGASILAKKYSQSRTATVALDKMVFRRPVWVGDVVSCYASLEKIGNTSLTIKTEAWVKRLESGQEEKVTEGLFTFVAIDEHGRPQYVDPIKRQQHIGTSTR